MTVMDPDDELPSGGPPRTISEHLLIPPASQVTPQLSDAQVDAFSAFYRAQVGRLVAFLRWQGAGLAEAADATQEAMIKAFQRWDTLTNPDAWVRTVATREFIRCRLRSSEDAVAELPEVTTVLLRHDPGMAGVEDEDEVLQLLARLPPRQRQVMAWTYDGYTPTQIAAELATPNHPLTPEAVRSTLKLARRALAEHWGPRKDQP